MKRFVIILLIFSIGSSVIAEIPADRTNKIRANRAYKMPQGTFKKTRSGKIVQYNNGKKIGVYKLNNGNLVRIK